MSKPRTFAQRGAISIAVGAMMAVMIAAPASANPGTSPTGVVVQEQLSTGNDLLVFVPDGSATGYRAASTPILLVFGSGSFTAASAMSVAQSSGLAEIAADEQGVVGFVNPKGSTWASGDAAAVTAALARFGDATGAPYDQNGKLCAFDFPTQQQVCKFPGSKSRVYLFGEGAGADFVSSSIVTGLPVVPPFPAYPGQVQTWTPTAVFLANATEAAVQPSVPVEVPAYLVNGSRTAVASYAALNTRDGLFGATAAGRNEAFSRSALLNGYDRVIEHAIQRTSELNDHMQGYAIPDYKAEGIDVTHSSITANGQPLEYFQYVPKSAKGKSIPLVLVFHGGGNHAEYTVWSTGWAEIAKKYGFMVVSVNRHVERTPADVMALVDTLLKDNPRIDTSRLYASGFSMGSVKTFALMEEFGIRFAAVAPMSGSFVPPATVPTTITPTIYFAGLQSPLPERPHQVGGLGNGQANDIDARLAALLAQNDVTDSYVYDPNADAVWGIAPDTSITIPDTQFTDVSVTVDTFASTDGKTYTALAAVHNGSHEALGIEAKIAWEFMSQFTRAADGGVHSTWTGLSGAF